MDIPAVDNCVGWDTAWNNVEYHVASEISLLT